MIDIPSNVIFDYFYYKKDKIRIMHTLKEINLSNKNLTEFDFRFNSMEYDISFNDIKELHVPKHVLKLTTSYNKNLSNISFDDSSFLTSLHITDTNLTNIELPRFLEFLFIGRCNINSLKLNDYLNTIMLVDIHLNELKINNKLTSLQFQNCVVDEPIFIPDNIDELIIINSDVKILNTPKLNHLIHDIKFDYDEKFLHNELNYLIEM